MSMPMEWDEPETEVVPLDLTTKKEDNYAASEVEAERDGPGKLTEDAPLLRSSAQKGIESTPLNLSDRTAFPLQPPPTSANVTQRSTVVTLSPKVQDESLPPPQPQCKDYWTPATPLPMMATEHLAPLHGTYADPAAYRHMVLSSAAVPEYNPFPPVLPTSTATQFHQHNQIQDQLTLLHMQQQHLLNLQHHHHLQQNLYKQQKLHASMLSCSPVYTATSSPSSSQTNHFPRPTTDNHYHFHRQQQQLQRDLDREASRRSQDAKRQKYVENQIIVTYLTKKVKKMEDMKRRLLMGNSNILSE